MDSSENNEVPNLNLPTPISEVSAEQTKNVNDQMSSNKEVDPSLELGNSVPSVNAINQKVQSIISDNGSNSNISDSSSNTTVLPPVSTTTPLTADDDDLIEKEWVDKAKEIINKNREDPYLQSVEIGHVRVDYMKKRYNKDIKLSE